MKTADKAKKLAKPSKTSTLATSADIHQKSDPICGTGGCVKFKNPLEKKPDHPTGYSVPDFGVDEDVIATQAHMKQQEKTLGVNWNPDQDDSGKWIVPTSEAEFHLTGTKTDIHLKDDPVCISTGCET